MPYVTQYNFVNFFLEYKKNIEVIDGSDKEIYGHSCSDVNSDYVKDYAEVTNTCIKGMKYLHHIKCYSPNDDADRCKYLHYFLDSDSLEKKKTSDRILSFYNELLRIYEIGEDPHICKTYIDEINNFIPEKAEKFIELYKTLYNTSSPSKNYKEDCHSLMNSATLYNNYIQICHDDYDYNFCYELENFKDTYEKTVKTLNCGDNVPNTLPSGIINNVTVIALIPIAITLILPFILFILHKFTPFVSWINPLINRKKNVQNNMDVNMSQLPNISEVQNRNLGNGTYHLTYSTRN
ncbi:PIR Superfamily Protein [Plasmodium ovale curtisi]|uniref:PIR Superfamily Protein n=1 Tax=Plasmodium ovale curtisi TaxID=864141 RepID=A0A1A8VKW6_PLAOA|nr:PIR Superfamily Protein [Plasmodium ovale curtisi]